MAAGATGVGLLALAPPAKADIVEVSVGVPIYDSYEIRIDLPDGTVGLWDFWRHFRSGGSSGPFSIVSNGVRVATSCRATLCVPVMWSVPPTLSLQYMS